MSSADSEVSEDLDKICSTLDKLTLDALTLMQEEIGLKLNVENAMIEGETHLAKSRYILGQHNVSALQLPTKHGPEITAITKVFTIENETSPDPNIFELHEIKKSEDENVQNPIRWFGYFVPQNLKYAQSMFKQALQWVVQAANVQNQLQQTLVQIDQLEQLKEEIKGNSS